MEEDYKIEHQAPNKESDCPMHDLSGWYPDDIYSSNALRLYGDGFPSDAEAIRIIQSAKGKPNMRVTVYRALPNNTKQQADKIKALQSIILFYQKYGFTPVNNPIVNEIQLKYDPNGDAFTGHKFNELRQLILVDIANQIKELKESIKGKSYDINKGDWVTITKAYAKEHGEAHVKPNYKIVSKVVKAKELFTDANSLQEWGYDF